MVATNCVKWRWKMWKMPICHRRRSFFPRAVYADCLFSSIFAMQTPGCCAFFVFLVIFDTAHRYLYHSMWWSVSGAFYQNISHNAIEWDALQTFAWLWQRRISQIIQITRDRTYGKYTLTINRKINRHNNNKRRRQQWRWWQIVWVTYKAISIIIIRHWKWE